MVEQSPFDLNNKNAVITGGATGIGFAIAKGLGARGGKILIAEPDEARLKTAVEALSTQEIEATHTVCDVTDLDQVERLADAAWDHFGRVDMVFNNAGISVPQAPIIEASMDDLHRVFNVNFFWCVAWLPRLCKAPYRTRITGGDLQHGF